MPRSRDLERGAVELSREARERLAWFDYYVSHGRNVALTCRHSGISRKAFYRWKPRYDPWEQGSGELFCNSRNFEFKETNSRVMRWPRKTLRHLLLIPHVVLLEFNL